MKSRFKQAAEKWAEGVLEKEPKQSFECIAQQRMEIDLLGGLYYDDKGNWIPYFDYSEKFEVKPVEVKDGVMIIKV